LREVIDNLPEWCWLGYLPYILVHILENRAFLGEFTHILKIVAKAYPSMVFFTLRGLYHKYPLTAGEATINSNYTALKKSEIGLIFKRTNLFFKKLIHSLVLFTIFINLVFRGNQSQNLHI